MRTFTEDDHPLEILHECKEISGTSSVQEVFGFFPSSLSFSSLLSSFCVRVVLFFYVYRGNFFTRKFDEQSTKGLFR